MEKRVTVGATKVSSFYLLELFGLIHKLPGHDQFFAESLFSAGDLFLFTGLAGQSCHCRCNSLRQLALY